MAFGARNEQKVREIVKPRTDKRDYRRIVLHNALEVLLISCPETDKALEKEDSEDGNNSDSSSYSNDNEDERLESKSITTSWPQIYRQSIDLYSSVPSPSLNFPGMPMLSRLGSSFISSSLTRRYTPEVLPSSQKPLLPPVANARQPPERRSSHSLLPSIQRKPSLRKATADRKSSKVSHEVSLPRQSSYGQAVVNDRFI